MLIEPLEVEPIDAVDDHRPPVALRRVLRRPEQRAIDDERRTSRTGACDVDLDRVERVLDPRPQPERPEPPCMPYPRRKSGCCAFTLRKRAI